MMPNHKIRINTEGNSHIEGMEQSDQCSKLKEMGRMAGTVLSEEDKDHQPVYQDVNRKGA